MYVCIDIYIYIFFNQPVLSLCNESYQVRFRGWTQCLEQCLPHCFSPEKSHLCVTISQVMDICQLKFTPQWFHSLIHKGSVSQNCPMISGISSGKEKEGPSHGRACPVGPSTTKASWFPFLPNYHSFPGSCPLSYPEELTNLSFFIMGKHILLHCKG